MVGELTDVTSFTVADLGKLSIWVEFPTAAMSFFEIKIFPEAKNPVANKRVAKCPVTRLRPPPFPIYPNVVYGTVEEILRDQNHFFVANFVNISNKKLGNVSYESYIYPTF